MLKKLVLFALFFCLIFSFSYSQDNQEYRTLNKYCQLGSGGDVLCDEPYNGIGSYLVKKINKIDDVLFVNHAQTRKDLVKIRLKLSSALYEINERKSTPKTIDTKKLLLYEIIEYYIDSWMMRTEEMILNLKPLVASEFDECGYLQDYLDDNKFGFRDSGLLEWILDQKTGVGPRYRDIPQSTYSLDFEACYSKRDSQLIFFLAGQRTCRSLHRYDVKNNIVYTAVMYQGACPSSFGERNKELDYIELYGYIDDGVLYTGKYFYKDDIVTM